jgi:hypothetical protein
MSFSLGFLKKADSEEEHPARKAFGIGTGLGAAANIAHNTYLDRKEKRVPHARTVHKFRRNLKPGDIILSGSTARHADGIAGEDLPKVVQKLLTRYKIPLDKTLINNSTLLTSVGAGGKYHASVYLGKNRVGEMSTDMGATTSSLKELLEGQNATAYRFTGAGKRETGSAVSFAKRMAKKHHPYKSELGSAAIALGNIATPFGSKVCRKTKSGMVCSTLPIRAYHKRQFPKGEWTYPGDIRKAKGLHPVVRRESVKLPFVLRARTTAGQALKGVKWGLGAAGLAAAHHYLKNRLKPSER